MVDVNKVLKNTVKQGKVKIGKKETMNALNKDETVKMVVLSKNCPNTMMISDLAKKKKVPIYQYKSNSIDLGYTCGKAFAVSVMAVLDDGGSNILSIVKKG